MGFRYRKRINLGAGVRLNISNKGIGVSAGVKGLRVSKGTDGKTRMTASLPGTGLSYQQTLNGGTRKGVIRKQFEQQYFNYAEAEQELGHLEAFEQAPYIHYFYGTYVDRFDEYNHDGSIEREPGDKKNHGRFCRVKLTPDEVILYFGDAGMPGYSIRYTAHFPAEQLAFSKCVEHKKILFISSTRTYLTVTLDRDYMKEVFVFKVGETMADEAIKWLELYKEDCK